MTLPDVLGSQSPKSRIAFQRWYGNTPIVLAEGIWTVNADGSDSKLVHANGKEPKWSPDARWIAFIKELDVSGETIFSTIFIMDRDGNHVQQKTFDTEHNVGSPSWSPDSRHLVYSVYFWEKELNHLFVLDLLSEQTRQLTFEGDNLDPVWTPDNEIVFVKGEQMGDRGQNFVINPDGRNEREFKLLDSDDRSPVWTDDGRKILVNRDWTFHIMNSDGSGLQAIPEQEGIVTQMTISPDALSIAYSVRDEFEYDVFVVDLDGTGRRKIATNSRAMAWSPLY